MTVFLRQGLFILCVLLVSGRAEALHVLLANDDGYEAPGLAALAQKLASAGHRVTVVAPRTDQSGTSARITTAPFAVQEARKGVFVVDGSPADAVWVGLQRVLRETPPDLVISGANRGQNLGAIAHLSGTVGAALMASLNGVPAIAVSVGLDFGEAAAGFPATLAAYPAAAAWVTTLVAALEKTADGAALLPKGAFLNVNYPALPAEAVKAAVWAPPGEGWGYAVNYAEVAPAGTVKLAFGADPEVYPADAVSDTARFAAGHVTVSLLFTGFGAGDAAAEAALRARLEGLVAR